MTERARATPVLIERGARRVFASALEWPGLARSGGSEEDALAALLAYGPRYAKVARGLGFTAPTGAASFRVVERVAGNATTDFGAPGVAGKADAATVGAGELTRLGGVLTACWKAFDAGVAKAKGRTLATGPRGGGRSLVKIVAHVREAELGYLAALGAPYRSERVDPKAERAAVLAALGTSARGEIAAKGPRGGVRWKPRFFVRRATWHVLDHLWEIEDRSA